MAHSTPGMPPGAGKSSFDLIDAARLFKELDLQPGITFLDLGCGEGNYTLPVARAIGPTGLAYAVDLWAEGMALLKEKVKVAGLENIKALVAEVGEIPIDSATVDVCFLATVLHDLVEAHTADGALREVNRVLKPEGVLAIAEFKKIESHPGPPVHIRLDPEELARIVEPYGFSRQSHTEVGPVIYLMIFRKGRATAPGRNEAG